MSYFSQLDFTMHLELIYSFNFYKFLLQNLQSHLDLTSLLMLHLHNGEIEFYFLDSSLKLLCYSLNAVSSNLYAVPSICC